MVVRVLLCLAEIAALEMLISRVQVALGRLVHLAVGVICH